jgi:hypothetical protein
MYKWPWFFVSPRALETSGPALSPWSIQLTATGTEGENSQTMAGRSAIRGSRNKNAWPCRFKSQWKKIKIGRYHIYAYHSMRWLAALIYIDHPSKKNQLITHSYLHVAVPWCLLGASPVFQRITLTGSSTNLTRDVRRGSRLSCPAGRCPVSASRIWGYLKTVSESCIRSLNCTNGPLRHA